MIFIYQTLGGLAPEAQRYATPEVKKSGWTVIKEYVYIKKRGIMDLLLKERT